MYYSKNSAPRITVPRNYSGNTFRPDEEYQSSYINEVHAPDAKDPLCNDPPTCDEKMPTQPLFSALSGISSEDFLLLGLIFFILRENQNDDLILLLLLLLIIK